MGSRRQRRRVEQRLREACEKLDYDFRLITRNADRDAHLRSNDFFGRNRYKPVEPAPIDAEIAWLFS